MRDKLRIELTTGLMIESVHPSQFGDDIIETPCLIPFHHPRWDGTHWIEGATEIPKQEQQPPTLEERLQALEKLELERMFEL